MSARIIPHPENGQYDIVDANGYVMGVAFDPRNAALFSAASDLLTACEAVIQDGGYDDDGNFFLTSQVPDNGESADYEDPEAICKVNDAIAKAKQLPKEDPPHAV